MSLRIPQSTGFIVGLPERCVSNALCKDVPIYAPRGLAVHNAKTAGPKNLEIEMEQEKPLLLEDAAEASDFE